MLTVVASRAPHSPRPLPFMSLERVFTGELFGLCRDIIELPEGFDFDKESVWAGYEEIGEEVLSSWERQEPDLVTA